MAWTASVTARVITTAGVQHVLALGEEHLPAGVERSHCIFMPEAMFSTRHSRDAERKIRRDSLMVASSTVGLGISLASRPKMGQPTVFHLFDVPHYFWVYFGDGKENSEDESGPSTLRVLSVGIGVVTMIGGQAAGIRAFVEGAVRVADILSHVSGRHRYSVYSFWVRARGQARSHAQSAGGFGTPSSSPKVVKDWKKSGSWMPTPHKSRTRHTRCFASHHGI